MLNLVRLVVSGAREHGLRETLKSVPLYVATAPVRWLYAAENALLALRGKDFDARFGTDTTRSAELLELPSVRHHDPVEFHPYVTLPERALREAIGRLAIRFEDFVFVDVGCGKGRPLLVATESPFRRVLGVELAEELCTIARANAVRYRPQTRQCFEVDVRCDDATTFELPAEPCVLYLFNPFGPRLMMKFLMNLRRSLDENPREIWVIYARPMLGELFTEILGFEKVYEETSQGSLLEAGFAVFRRPA